MEIKTLFVALLLLLATTVSFALTPQDLAWDGYANISLDKSSFSADENITGHITLTNNEDYSMVGNKLVFQIAQGTYSYPSELSNDNIVLESSLSDIWVLPRSMKTINFSLDKQSPGDYRLDVYSWILKSKFIGASSIFLSPSSTNFSVVGTPPSINVIIDRKNTAFGADAQKLAGPNGFPISAGKTINGTVVVQNNSSSTVQGLKLALSICDWAGAFCPNPKEQLFDVPSLAANETKEIAVTLTAPQIPSAYEINIKLLNKTTALSIYKNRVIVTGGTAKLRKVFIDGLKDKIYSITALISGSPDHFTNPVFENFQITKQLFNKEELVSEELVTVNKLNYSDINSFTFEAKTPMFDKACLKIIKENITFEEECFSVPLEEMQKSYDELNPRSVEVTWSYNESSSVLTLNLKKESLNARYKIITTDKTLFGETIIQKGDYKKEIPIEKNDLILIVDDFDAKNQQVITINLVSTNEQIISTQETDINNTGKNILCKETLCKSNETCTGAYYPSANGTCCTATCIPSVSQNVLELPPLIAIIAIILVIAAILVGFTVLKELKK